MKILLAVDGSKYASAAAVKCCEIISVNDDSEIKIIGVADTSKAIGTEPYGVFNEFHLTINKELKKTAETNVEEAQTIVKEKVGDQVKIETEVLIGSPKAVIVEEAEKWGADLIIVGSHGYGFFSRMLIGSVSDAVLHHAPCSVLVVKVADTDDSEN